MIQVNAQPGASLTVDFYYDDFIYLKELLLILLLFEWFLLKLCYSVYDILPVKTSYG